MRATCLLLALLSFACAQDLQVEVTVKDQALEVALLEVRATLAGVPAQRERTVTGRGGRFMAQLPPTSQGPLVLSLSGRDHDRCLLQRGEGQVDLPAGREVTVTMAALPEAACQIEVALTGDGVGRVFTQGGEIDCPGVCAARLPAGRQLSLQAALLDTTSFFNNWVGPGRTGCDTQGDSCAVTVSGEETLRLKAHFAPKRLCTGDGWCRENPLPVGRRLRAVQVMPNGEVWAVGDGAIRLRGGVWTEMAPASQQLNGVFGRRADVWAVGERGAVLHWNAGDRAAVTTPSTLASLYGIASAGPEDLWVVGTGIAWRSQGGGPFVNATPADAGVLTAVWGSPSGEVWAVGQRIFRWDGTLWAQVLPMGLDPLVQHTGVWGTAAGDLWIVGLAGTLVRTGGSWRWYTEHAQAVWGSGNGDVWGTASGCVARWAGQRWDLQHCPPQPGNAAALHGADDGTLWAVGAGGVLLRRAQGAWRTLSKDIDPRATAIWGSGPNDIWIVGQGAILHYDGISWERSAVAADQDLLGVWGSGPGDVWAVGGQNGAGAIFHWDGQRWTRDPLQIRSLLTGIWGSDANHVWAVGKAGLLLRWDGRAWLAETGPSVNNNYSCIGGSSPLERWIGGSTAGQAWHSLEGGWEAAPIPGCHQINGFWTSGPDQVWAACQSILNEAAPQRWDPAQRRWTPVGRTSLPRFLSVWGNGLGQVWFSGSGGHLYRIDGGVLTAEDGGVPELGAELSGLWGAAGGDLWAVGNAHVVRRRR